MLRLARELESTDINTDIPEIRLSDLHAKKIVKRIIKQVQILEQATILKAGARDNSKKAYHSLVSAFQQSDLVTFVGKSTKNKAKFYEIKVSKCGTFLDLMFTEVKKKDYPKYGHITQGILRYSPHFLERLLQRVKDPHVLDIRLLAQVLTGLGYIWNQDGSKDGVFVARSSDKEADNWCIPVEMIDGVKTAKSFWTARESC
jgi:hypothetical protein